MKQVKKICYELHDFIDFMGTTGLRYEEVFKATIIIKLSKEGKLNQYYDSEREILEHFRFKEVFLRHTKKAFITFVPKALIERIGTHKRLTVNIISKRVQRRIGKLRFGDIREVHGTLLTNYLKEVEINFLHGRFSSLVFMTNYFNPVWIANLKDRTLNATETN
jgi:intergrase/recombinase